MPILLTLWNHPLSRLLLLLLNWLLLMLLLLIELLKNGLFGDWKVNEFPRLLLFRLFPANFDDDVGNVRDAETVFVKPLSTLPLPKLLIFVPVITFPWGVPYASGFGACAWAWLNVCMLVGVIWEETKLLLFVNSWLLFAFGVDKT